VDKSQLNRPEHMPTALDMARIGPRKTTSPDRAEIEEVMSSAVIPASEDVNERNAARRWAVEQFLDSDTGYNLDQMGPQSMTLREMILDDLDSYESWEKS
jgi:hypothetical protein